MLSSLWRVHHRAGSFGSFHPACSKHVQARGVCAFGEASVEVLDSNLDEDGVCHSTKPLDAEDGPHSSQMECIHPLFLSRVKNPRLAVSFVGPILYLFKQIYNDHVTVPSALYEQNFTNEIMENTDDHYFLYRDGLRLCTLY